MTTSEYLNTQAVLLVALNTVRTVDLAAFVGKAREVAAAGELRDHTGQAAATDPIRMIGLARAFQSLLATESARVRKPAASVASGYQECRCA